jgi:hypothetical protein
MPLSRSIVQLGIVLCCLTVPGCRGMGRSSENAGGAGTVTHAVLFWLKDSGNDNDRRELIAACHALKDVPGVQSLRVGKALPSTRPVVDSSYDVGLVITFESARAMQEYGPHPVHQKLVQGMGPRIQKFVIYDFVNE